MHIDSLKYEDYENTLKLNFGCAVRRKYDFHFCFLWTFFFSFTSSFVIFHWQTLASQTFFMSLLRFWPSWGDSGGSVTLVGTINASRFHSFYTWKLTNSIRFHWFHWNTCWLAIVLGSEKVKLHTLKCSKWSQLNTDINLLIHYTKFISLNNMCHYVTSQLHVTMLKRYMLTVKTSPYLLREAKRERLLMMCKTAMAPALTLYLETSIIYLSKEGSGHAYVCVLWI